MASYEALILVATWKMPKIRLSRVFVDTSINGPNESERG